MTLTYNGSTITTDTLYENGTIKVKRGCVVKREEINLPTVNSTKIKIKAKTILFGINESSSLPSVRSTKVKTKTKIKTNQHIETTSALPTVVTNKITVKTSIVIP